MPVSPTYPGVYIEEIPSGVRTIVGVATSITAFVGRTARGPVNDPQMLTSFADFERKFGGLAANYPLSYAVRDFYRNGGKQALIVRLFKDPDPATAQFQTGDLKLIAANPGTWGNKLSIKIDHDVSDEVLQRYGLANANKALFFNLTVIESPPFGPREVFRNVSLEDKAGSRRLDLVLANESNLVRLDGALPTPATRPAVTDKAADPTNRENFDSKTGQSKGQVDMFQQGVDSAHLALADYQRGKDSGVQPIPKTGLYALDKADLFNLLCIPPDVWADQETTANATERAKIYAEALTYCTDRRAMLIVDPPAAWGKNAANAADNAQNGLSSINPGGTIARNAAIYFPWVKQADPLREGQIDTFAPCGIIAGVMARTDRDRGVWKAPAGIDAALNGIVELQVNLTDDENGSLNQLGINCLRTFPIIGSVVWGARTLRGADQLADEYKYIPVRRTALFIEESLYRGLKWVVFEPNNEPLWAQIRLNVGAFMRDLFRKGAFQGITPRDAYFVKCDKETTTQNDINLGIVNIVVGFAPLKPAEFVIVKIQQMAGQIEV